jgi:hypothetical protein
MILKVRAANLVREYISKLMCSPQIQFRLETCLLAGAERTREGLVVVKYLPSRCFWCRLPDSPGWRGR